MDINKEILKNDTTLLFTPSTITLFNASDIKKNILSIIDNTNLIDINLENVIEFDIAGLQLLIALKNYGLINGIQVKIINISEIIETKISILGVEL